MTRITGVYCVTCGKPVDHIKWETFPATMNLTIMCHGEVTKRQVGMSDIAAVTRHRVGSMEVSEIMLNLHVFPPAPASTSPSSVRHLSLYQAHLEGKLVNGATIMVVSVGYNTCLVPGKKYALTVTPQGHYYIKCEHEAQHGIWWDDFTVGRTKDETLAKGYPWYEVEVNG